MNRPGDFTYYSSANCGVCWYGLLAEEITIILLDRLSACCIIRAVVHLFWASCAEWLFSFGVRFFCHVGTRLEVPKD